MHSARAWRAPACAAVRDAHLAHAAAAAPPAARMAMDDVSAARSSEGGGLNIYSATDAADSDRKIAA